MKLLRIAIIFIILLFIGGFIFIAFQGDPQTYLLEILDKQNNKLLSIVLVLFGLTTLSTLTGLPVFYFSIAIGFFLNYLPALILAWSMNLIAILITFFMVKKVFSEVFLKKYGKRKNIEQINQRIMKYGLWTVAMSRGVYVLPTNIINFSFPLSKLPTKQYIVGTMIGLIPECLINITTGYLLKHQYLLLNSPQQNFVKIGIIGVFLLLMAAGILFINYRRRKVKKAQMNKIIPRLED